MASEKPARVIANAHNRILVTIVRRRGTRRRHVLRGPDVWCGRVHDGARCLRKWSPMKKGATAVILSVLVAGCSDGIGRVSGTGSTTGSTGNPGGASSAG